jgi:carbonic anhydrase/acetyltransferase-like protein (isoleucine patch superfamily)
MVLLLMVSRGKSFLEGLYVPSFMAQKDEVTRPKVHPSCYVAPNAVIVGNVEIGPDCSIWDYATIRGDFNRIVIEEGSNIQEHAAIHVTPFNSTHIGKNVSVGHNAVVHAATVKDQCIIGMHATVLDGAVIGEFSIVGGNALVKEKFEVPPMSLVVGIPAKVVKSGDEKMKEATLRNAQNYHRLRDEHKAGKHGRFKL